MSLLWGGVDQVWLSKSCCLPTRGSNEWVWSPGLQRLWFRGSYSDLQRGTWERFQRNSWNFIESCRFQSRTKLEDNIYI